jgi:hypothetical protein
MAILRNERHAGTPMVVDAPIRHLHPGDPNASGVGRPQADTALGELALPVAFDPRHPHDLARADGEVDAVEEVAAVAASGATMPQKSTYFYPKLLSGLLFHPL